MKNIKSEIRETVKKIVSEAMDLKEMKVEGGDLEGQIRKYFELSEKFKKLKAEYDELESEFKASEEPIREMLDNLNKSGDKVLELDDIVIQIKKAGHDRESFKYKEGMVWLYERANIHMRNLVDEMLMNHKSLTYIKTSLEIKKKDELEEGFSAITDKIKSWFSKLSSFFKTRTKDLQSDIDYYRNEIEGSSEGPEGEESLFAESKDNSNKRMLSETKRMRQLAGIISEGFDAVNEEINKEWDIVQRVDLVKSDIKKMSRAIDARNEVFQADPSVAGKVQKEIEAIFNEFIESPKTSEWPAFQAVKEDPEKLKEAKRQMIFNEVGNSLYNFFFNSGSGSFVRMYQNPYKIQVVMEMKKVADAFKFKMLQDKLQNAIDFHKNGPQESAIDKLRAQHGVQPKNVTN